MDQYPTAVLSKGKYGNENEYAYATVVSNSDSVSMFCRIDALKETIVAR